jgi:hypothetical protein
MGVGAEHAVSASAINIIPATINRRAYFFLLIVLSIENVGSAQVLFEIYRIKQDKSRRSF